MNFEYGIGGKWLELLKQIAPGVSVAGHLRPDQPLRDRPFGAIQGGAFLRRGGDSGRMRDVGEIDAAWRHLRERRMAA